MGSNSVESRAACTAALLLALACQAFEPTIAERQAHPEDPLQDVPLSLLEEFPSEFSLPHGIRDEPQPLPPAEPPYVAPVIGGDEMLQVEFRDANLSQVVHFIADRAGVNIVLDPYLDRAVDVSFPKITLDGALQALLAHNGMRLIEDPPGIYWISLHDGTQAAQARFTVQSIKAPDIEANLRTLVSRDAKLVVDAAQNLIVVSGTQSDVDLVRTYLESADRLRRQVLVEVRVLEVSLGQDFQLGIAGMVDGTLNDHLWSLMENLSAPSQNFSFQFTSEDGNVDATISALHRLTGTNLLSSPRVLALSGTEALIEVIQEIPYINVTSTTTGTTGGVGSTVVQEVQFKEAGIKLKVTPTIQERGTIQVHIDQELSEVVDNFNGIPVLDTRNLLTDFLVRDRETVVLGGLMQNRRTEIDRGVPGLMDIPLLGRLFRSDGDDSDKRELLVFLTPHIVATEEEAATLARAFERSYREQVRSTGVRPLVPTPKKSK